MPFISPNEISHLPLPDLALLLLRNLASGGGSVNLHSLLRGMEQSAAREQFVSMNQGAATLTEEHLARIADAWAWLESHGLLSMHHTNGPTGHWQRVTKSGADLAADPNALSKVWADDRLAGDLHPSLSSARSNFALGDYETASFAAMKAVEVEVRRVAGLSNDIIGVPLMRKAFNPKDGVLRDHEAEGGEQQATMDLFAGAIGAYKNPASHRTVSFDDAVEAAEVLQLADLLLRIVQRAESRMTS